MTNNEQAAELTELEPLMREARCWPGELDYNAEFDTWQYKDCHGCTYPIQEHHTLDIVRGCAERWLSDRDWECVRLAQGKGHNYWCKKYWSLKGVTSPADAIRTEMGRTTPHGT